VRAAARARVRPALLPIAALAAGLLLGPAAPSAAAPDDALARIAAQFAEGEAMSFQLVFDRPDGGVAGDDVRAISFNTTVDACWEGEDEDGAYVQLATADFRHRGVDHYFTALVRGDGQVTAFDLVRLRRDGEWEVVPVGVFFFEIPDPADGYAELDAEGDVVLSQTGLANRRRGAPDRDLATLFIRSYPVEGGERLRF